MLSSSGFGAARLDLKHSNRFTCLVAEVDVGQFATTGLASRRVGGKDDDSPVPVLEELG